MRLKPVNHELAGRSRSACSDENNPVKGNRIVLVGESYGGVIALVLVVMVVGSENFSKGAAAGNKTCQVFGNTYLSTAVVPQVNYQLVNALLLEF